MDKLILIQLPISGALFLLIWFVQILHYPIFYFIDEKRFPESMVFHQKFISFLTLPLMLIELVLSVYAVYLNYAWSYYVLGIVGLIWLSTFLVQVPLHNKLLAQKDHILIKKLIQSNWIRTWLWTLKTVIVVYLAFA
jgi:hypothetical protein